MNPFSQLISPSLFIHLLVILIGKKNPKLLKLVRMREWGGRTVQCVSIFIAVIIAWMVCVGATVIFLMSITDAHSNIHIVIQLADHLTLWLRDNVGFVQVRERDVIFTILPLPLAAVATAAQQVRRRLGKIEG